MGVTVLVFVVELQKGYTKCLFSDFWERTGMSFKMVCTWKRKESIKKSLFTEFTSIRTQCDKDGTWMKIKVSEYKFNFHYRGSLWGGRTQQHTFCLPYAHSLHIESHIGRKHPIEIIPVALLFSQLHFNKVTSDALFHGGHLVMRSMRCAVQNQQITLKFLGTFDFAFQCLWVLLYNCIPVPPTLLDKPEDSRFWTVSPGLQIREWNLLGILRSL